MLTTTKLYNELRKLREGRYITVSELDYQEIKDVCSALRKEGMNFNIRHQQAGIYQIMKLYVKRNAKRETARARNRRGDKLEG